MKTLHRGDGAIGKPVPERQVGRGTLEYPPVAADWPFDSVVCVTLRAAEENPEKDSSGRVEEAADAGPERGHGELSLSIRSTSVSYHCTLSDREGFEWIFMPYW
ncbi:uncharacterized protein N7483_006150 [Penicillium malachiteum]|uniref:uncharacterized protein n=1 Tax=Penicillium malachiteum TaxID=1324776 RepID=UPI0025470DC3|nr:uncharacterized protein N7483_006150 [Penicillium malachiteum]KAJ5731642.1 hypothetical protein N7483_006150 [Penicillium malachiteum]